MANKFYNKKNHLIKTFLSVFLIIIMLFSWGCGNDKANSSKNVDPITAENAANSFHTFTSSLLQSELNSNTISLHFTAISPSAVGIDNYELSIGHYSMEAMKAAYAKIKEYQTQLSQISYDALSDEDKLTYDIINWYFSHQINPEEFPYFEEPLTKTIGLQSQLPIIFSEYRFRNEKDINDYLQLLSLIPTYFDEIIAYEQEKSAAGMFMASFSAERVITSIEAFLVDTENHYLISSFNERLEEIPSLSDEQKSSYIDQNKQVLNDCVFSSYRKLCDAITAIKDTGTNTGGLCGLNNGAAYYEKLLQHSIGTNKSTNELITMIDSKLSSDLNNLGSLLTSNTNLMENLNDLKLDITEPKDILDTLLVKMADDFPSAVNCTYNIKEINENLQSTLSPAFYIAPPIDSTDENTIYINPSYNNDSLTLFSTLAHEGFPGHMYQNLYTSSNQTDPVRSIFSFTGYSEGYATYAELFSYKYLNFDEELNQILALSSSITLAIYARLDLAIHYEGYNYNQTHDFLVKYGITDPKTTTEIYQSIIEQPGNYMCYYGGYLEFLELRDKAEELQKKNFSLKEFHNYILSVGDAPFEILEKYLQ